MFYSSFAPNPQFTKYLVKNEILKNRPLAVVDVGSRGGLEHHWTNYDNAVQFIGFEPDSEECERLNNSLNSGSNSRFYPVALYKDKGSYVFYHNQASAASGLYPADQKIVSRFPDEENLKIRKTSIIHTTDFDSFIKDYNIPDIDFMKIDAEGADLDILKGSINQLKKSVLGISCEVFFAPWRGEGRGFSEIEQFLRPLGFRLYDLNLYRYAKKSFPGIDSVAPFAGGTAHYGQIVLGQAIFFRDPVAEIENKKILLSDWDETRILKAVSLFEVFRLPDCAIELIDTAFKNKIITNSEKINMDKFRDLVTSGFLGRATTYKRHLQKLANIKKRGYLNNFERLKPFLKKIPCLMGVRSFIKKQIAYHRNNYNS